MPISYWFEDTMGQKVPLDIIDQLICDDFKQKCYDSHFSVAFHLITMIGDNIDYSQEFDEQFNHSTEPTKIKKYLNGDYRYFSIYSTRA